MGTIADLTNLTPSIAMSIIFAYLYLNIVKQMDKADARRDAKDSAFLQSLDKINTRLDLIKSQSDAIAENLRMTAQINSQINEKIMDKFDGLKCKSN